MLTLQIRIISFIRIIVYYIDLVKDLFLLIAICVAVDISKLEFDCFASQLIIAYVLSILIPLFVNWVNIAFYHLEESCGFFDGSFPKNKRFLFQIITLFFIPFMPGVLLYQSSKKYEKIFILQVKS